MGQCLSTPGGSSPVRLEATGKLAAEPGQLEQRSPVNLNKGAQQALEESFAFDISGGLDPGSVVVYRDVAAKQQVAPVEVVVEDSVASQQQEVVAHHDVIIIPAEHPSSLAVEVCTVEDTSAEAVLAAAEVDRLVQQPDVVVVQAEVPAAGPGAAPVIEGGKAAASAGLRREKKQVVPPHAVPASSIGKPTPEARQQVSTHLSLGGENGNGNELCWLCRPAHCSCALIALFLMWGIFPHNLLHLPCFVSPPSRTSPAERHLLHQAPSGTHPSTPAPRRPTTSLLNPWPPLSRLPSTPAQSQAAVVGPHLKGTCLPPAASRHCPV